MTITDYSQKISKIQDSLHFRGNSIVYVPGLFFVLLGITSLIAPSALVAIMAALFLFLGCMLSFLAWKFVQLKTRIEKMAKDFDGRIQIQGLNVLRQNDDQIDSGKKIVFH